MQVKSVFDSNLYKSTNIYNVDEIGFDYNLERRQRKVGPKGGARNGQAGKGNSEHITSVVCIGIAHAPVPPLIIYRGQNLQQSWFEQHEDVAQRAIVTDSGWTNDYVQMKWLQEVFDPATKPIARNGLDRRLLFLDGLEAHTRVTFLEACWERNIICVLLPAHLSGRLQPLDVDFFNTLKKNYHYEQEAFQLGGVGAEVDKGMFWAWHQRA